MTTTRSAHAAARRFAARGLAGLFAAAALAALAACSSSPSVPLPSLSPGRTSSSSATASASPSSRTSPVVTTSPSGTARPSGRPSSDGSASPRPRRTRRTFPAAAPQTGGGGTAGLQDTGLLVLGGAAILAGAGSLAYRRRSLRDR